MAAALDHEHQHPDRLPFLRVVLGLRELRDIVAGITQRAQLAAIGERDWIIKGAIPLNDASPSEAGNPDLGVTEKS